MPSFCIDAARRDIVGMVDREDAVQTECSESEVEKERGRIGCDPVAPEIAAHAVAEVTGAVRGCADAEPGTADELVGCVPHDAEVVLDRGCACASTAAARNSASSSTVSARFMREVRWTRRVAPPHEKRDRGVVNGKHAQGDAVPVSVTG